MFIHSSSLVPILHVWKNTTFFIVMHLIPSLNIMGETKYDEIRCVLVMRTDLPYSDEMFLVPPSLPLPRISSRNPVLQNSFTFILPVGVLFLKLRCRARLFILLSANSPLTQFEYSESAFLLAVRRSRFVERGAGVMRTTQTTKWKRMIT